MVTKERDHERQRAGAKNAKGTLRKRQLVSLIITHLSISLLPHFFHPHTFTSPSLLTHLFTLSLLIFSDTHFSSHTSAPPFPNSAAAFSNLISLCVFLCVCVCVHLWVCVLQVLLFLLQRVDRYFEINN